MKTETILQKKLVESAGSSQTLPLSSPKHIIFQKAGFLLRRGLVITALFSLIAALCDAPLEAAGFTWDALNSDGVITDGAGTWDLTSKNWWNSGSDNVWVQGSDVQIGQIGGAGATTGGNTIITLAANISAGNLFTANNDNKLPAPVTINTGTYTLTFSGSIATATDLTINGNVAFTNGLNSLSTVTIGGVSTPDNRSTVRFTGNVDLGGGAITMSGNNGSNSTILSGTVVNVSGINEGLSTLSMTGTNAALTGSATINVTNGTLSMSGTFASNYAQTINVSGGTLDLTAGTYGSNFAANISQTNGTLKFKSSLFTSLTGTWSMSGGSLVLNGGLFSLPMGTGNGQFNYTGGQLGVSATGTYNFGGAGALLTWGSGGFNPTTALTLQSTNQVMTFANAIDLNSATTRTLQDGAGNGGGSLLILTGVIQNSSTGNLEIKATTNRNQGDTWIDFAAANTYSGTTFISGATGNNNPIRLILGASSGSYSSAAYAITGTVGGQLQIMPGNAGTTYVSGNITTPTGTNNTTNNFTSDVGYTLIIGGTGTVNNLASGTGVTVLTGTNTYTGSTLIKSGTLQIGNGGAAGSLPAGGGVNSLANTALVYNTSSTGTLTGLLTGSMSFTQAGTGMIVLANTETYTGSTSITSGTLQLGNGATNGSVASGTISNAGTLVFNTSGSLNYAGKITGAGAVVMSGTGNQTLSGPNNYTGATSVNSGTLRLGSATALGNTSALTIAGGATLNLSSGTGAQSTSLAGNLVLGNGAMLNFGIGSGTADQLTIAGNVSLTGTTLINLLITGTGVSNFTIINSNNPFNLISGGTFALGTLPTLTTASLVQTSSALQVTFSAIPTVYWKGTGTSASGNWSDYSNFTSDITGTTPINAQFGSFQDVVFSANGAANQNSTIVDYNATAKSLTINDTAAVAINGSSGHSLTLTGSGITAGNSAGSVSIGTNLIITGAGNLTANNAGGITISGNISSANPLIVNGTTLVTLTGTNTSTGIQLQSGTLNVNSDNALGAAGSAVTFNGSANATLQFAATGATAATRNYVFTSGTGTIDTQADAVTIGGTLSGAGVFNKTGAGQLVINAANDLLSGTALISGGTLTVLNPGSFASLNNTGTSTYTINSGATMELSSTTANQFITTGGGKGITFGGSGTLLKSGTGNLVLRDNNNANTLNISMSGGGVFEIAAGILANGQNGSTGHSTWTNNKGSLKIDSGAAFDVWDSSPIYVDTLLGSGTLMRTGYSNQAPGLGVIIGTNNGTGTFAGVITNLLGQLNVTKQGTGLQVFSGSNGYSGPTSITGGTLRITNSAGLGFGGPSFATQGGQHTTTVSAGATLDLSSNITVNEAVTLNGASLINSGTGTTSVLDSGIAGIAFTNDPGSSGAYTVAFGPSSGTGAVATAGVLNNNGYITSAGNNLFTQMTTAGSGYRPDAAPVVTITKSGTAYGGTVTAVVSSVAMTGSNNFGGDGNLTVNAQISGAGSLFKTGTGTLILGGQNTYTGSTNINTGVVAVNGSLAAGSAVNVGGANTTGAPTLGGGIGAANGGALYSPTFSGGPLSRQVYTSSATVGNIQGAVTISGTAGGANAGILAPGNSVGTLTVGALTLNGGSVLNYEFNGVANDFTAVTGALTLNGVVGINLFIEGTTNQYSLTGTYALFSYGTASISALVVLNQNPADTYTFSNDTTNKLITLTISPASSTPNTSTLAITPNIIPIGGDVLVNKAATGIATGTLTNTAASGAGSADYIINTTGGVSVTPASSAALGGAGATLGEGQSQLLTISATGAAGSISGTGKVIGTVSATNLSNSNGSSSPVSVTANVYDAALVTPSTDGLTLFNSGTGSNGADSLIASAKIQSNSLIVGSTQNSQSWTMLAPSTPIVPGTTGTVATLNSSGLLNGTYHGVTSIKVGNVTSSGGAIGGATTGDVLNTSNYALTAVVTGNKSSGVGDTYEADIMNSYAGYGIQSSVAGTTHTNTGKGSAPGTTTIAVIADGQPPSNGFQLTMSFDNTSYKGPDTTRASDILTLDGLQASQGSDGRIFTDVYVLEMTYDKSADGLAYIVQNTGSGWINAVALNQAGSLTDDGGVDAIHESFEDFEATSGIVQGAYGYFDGVAWAILDHTANGSDGNNGIYSAEFAVMAQSVPEPGTYAMILAGAGMLAAFQRLRSRSRRLTPASIRSKNHS